jgi:hypothetical protein
MDWQTKEMERKSEIRQERERLLKMNDFEATKLPYHLQYERMRWRRELEAAQFVLCLQQGMTYKAAAEVAAGTYYG